MARCGIIPKELGSLDPPTCPGCEYGKAHRLQWRYKGGCSLKSICTATAPGQVVSVDQLVSPTPGFVPTHRGTPADKRYVGATIFVDHLSDYTYAHLMVKINTAFTTAAKEAFERNLAAYGVTFKHYHADNRLFDTTLFRSSVANAGQQMLLRGQRPPSKWEG